MTGVLRRENEQFSRGDGQEQPQKNTYITTHLVRAALLFIYLLRMYYRRRAQATKARSAARRVKVGRLEPGDLWGMQHARGGMEAGFEIVTVEGCEVFFVLCVIGINHGGGCPQGYKKEMLGFSPTKCFVLRIDRRRGGLRGCVWV